MDLFINLFHIALFTAANLGFFYAIYKRLYLIFKAGQPSGDLSSWGARIRSFLLNVVFQFKLFKRPVRGIMHAFIFYGFLIYMFHTTNQMIGGNLWYYFKESGMDPYAFHLTDYIWLGFSLSSTTTALLIGGLLVLIALTVMAMYSVRIGKRIHWRTSPGLQWAFLSLLSLEAGATLLVLLSSGTYFYKSFLLYFSLLVLFSLGFFAYRRWIRRSSELDVPSPQSAIVLLLISTLMLSTLFGDGAEALYKGSTTGIQGLIASFLELLGVQSKEGALAVRNFNWWLHICTVYAFMIYVPLSKHSHLIFAPINFFLIKKRPLGQMSMMDLEAEESVWGAAHISELPWKSLLDGLSCIECGRCTLVCPANLTGKPLDPKKIMVDIKHSMLEHQKALLEPGKGPGENPPSPILGKPYVTEEELWGCTSCNACVEACPVGNNQLDAILDMRRNLVLSESRFPAELQSTFQNMENQSNPWGMGSHTRGDWCQDLDVKTMAQDSDVDVLYWVGCAAAFDERNKKIARSFVSILNEAKVNFGILGTEENCTGDSARRGGNEYLYQTLAGKNIETLNKYKVKKIVTACPHCYNTLKNEYPQMGGNYEVQHHSDLIDDLLQEKKIKLDDEKVKSMNHRRATYHDSCYLGRYNEIFDEPRRITKKALGMDLAEPTDHGRTSLCCGAGGAQMWMEEKHEHVNQKRTQQLLDTGADTIATACPFCITMVSDGLKTQDLTEKVNVLDVAEIVKSSMEGSKDKLPASFTDKPARLNPPSSNGTQKA